MFESIRQESSGKITWIIVIAVILSVTAGVCYAKADPELTNFEVVLPDAVSYYNRGVKFEETGQYEKALADYSKALNLNPKFPEALTNRGNIYATREQYELALSDYHKAIELNPALWRTYKNRGQIYAMREQFEMAIADFTKTIELHPNDCCSYNFRAEVYSAIGRYDLAVEDLTKAINLQRHESCFYLARGVAYYRQGLFEKAIEDLNKGCDINQRYEYPYIWTLLAFKKLRVGDYAKYLREFKEYVLANKSQEWIRTISSYLLEIGGLTEEDVLAEARNGKDEREINRRLCEAYYYLAEERLWKGDRNGAEAFFKNSIDTNVRDFVEYGNAKAMLKLMAERKI